VRSVASKLIPFDPRAGDGQTQLSQHTISQYASSDSNWDHCYAERDVSSQAVTETIAKSHCTCLRGEGGVARLRGLDKNRDGRPDKGGHQSQ